MTLALFSLLERGIKGVSSLRRCSCSANCLFLCGMQLGGHDEPWVTLQSAYALREEFGRPSICTQGCQ